MNKNIKTLTPAAARLLLAMLSARPGETFADIVARSGIREVETFIKARVQLEVLGFVVCGPNGQEVATLFDIPSGHLDVGQQTRVTNAHTPPLQGR